jgi:hypothetical protein
MRESSCSVLYFQNPYAHPLVMRWRRNLEKEYDSELREWHPTEKPYDVLEPLFAIFYTAEELMPKIKSNEGRAMEEIGNIKAALHNEQLGGSTGAGGSRGSALEECQLVIIVFGMKEFCRGKPAAFRQAFIKFSLYVNVHHRAHVIYCEDAQGFVEKLFNISADQGIKIHKYASKSFLIHLLPFFLNSFVSGYSILPYDLGSLNVLISHMFPIYQSRLERILPIPTKRCYPRTTSLRVQSLMQSTGRNQH